jgi:acetyltransferase-like isoleucine patch superfamily enzyme
VLFKFILLKLLERIIDVPKRVNDYNRIELMKFRCVHDKSILILPSANIMNVRKTASRIKIGKATVVGGEVEVMNHGGEIEIGDSCFIGVRTHISSAASIKIGHRVLISYGVNIYDNISHSLSAVERHQHFIDIFTTGHPRVLDNVAAKPIVIEDDVWIGFDSTVLKGVRIGKGAIIGACSMVTHDVEPYAILVGNPARQVGWAKE